MSMIYVLFGIKIKIFEYEWNMMNLSAIIVDNMNAAVNMYLLGEDSITRVWKNYKYIERNKNRSNIEMFKIIDQWKNECSKICRPVEGL